MFFDGDGGGFYLTGDRISTLLDYVKKTGL